MVVSIVLTSETIYITLQLQYLCLPQIAQNYRLDQREKKKNGNALCTCVHVYTYTLARVLLTLASSPGPSLHGRRAWYTLTAHAPVCTQNLVTSYIPVKILSKLSIYDYRS